MLGFRSSVDAGGRCMRLSVVNGAAIAGTSLYMVLAVSDCNASRDTPPPPSVTTEQPGQTGDPETPTTEAPAEVPTTGQPRHTSKPEVLTTKRPAQAGGDLLPTTPDEPAPASRTGIDETTGPLDLPEPPSGPPEPSFTEPQPNPGPDTPEPSPEPEPSPTSPRTKQPLPEPNPNGGVDFSAPSQNSPLPEVTR
jgi:hypothetical protein